MLSEAGIGSGSQSRGLDEGKQKDSSTEVAWHRILIGLSVVAGSALAWGYFMGIRKRSKRAERERPAGPSAAEPVWPRILTGWALSLGDALIGRWIGGRRR